MALGRAAERERARGREGGEGNRRAPAGNHKWDSSGRILRQGRDTAISLAHSPRDRQASSSFYYSPSSSSHLPLPPSYSLFFAADGLSRRSFTSTSAARLFNFSPSKYLTALCSTLPVQRATRPPIKQSFVKSRATIVVFFFFLFEGFALSLLIDFFAALAHIRAILKKIKNKERRKLSFDSARRQKLEK